MGSGTLISPNLVITAAHNVFDRNYQQEYTELKCYLGADGDAEKYYEIESCRYPQEYKSTTSDTTTKYDYAILKLKLKQPLSFKEYLPLLAACPRCLLERNE